MSLQKEGSAQLLLMCKESASTLFWVIDTVFDGLSRSLI